MLSWGARRQLVILLILGVLCVLALGGVYFFVLKSGPTCFDGIKNQEEIDVDCGGGCARVCEGEVAPLITFWTRVFRVSEGVYDVGALLENPNAGFAIADLPYTIRVYDAKNILLAERPGTLYVNQKERLPLFEPRIFTGNLIPVRASLELGDFAWTRLPLGSARASGLAVENKQLNLLPAPRITAELVNTSPQALFDITISVVVYDAENNVLGISATHVDELARAARTQIGFTWPESFSGNPVSFEIYPRINAVTP